MTSLKLITISALFLSLISFYSIYFLLNEQSNYYRWIEMSKCLDKLGKEEYKLSEEEFDKRLNECSVENQ